MSKNRVKHYKSEMDELSPGMRKGWDYTIKFNGEEVSWLRVQRDSFFSNEVSNQIVSWPFGIEEDLNRSECFAEALDFIQYTDFIQAPELALEWNYRGNRSRKKLDYDSESAGESPAEELFNTMNPLSTMGRLTEYYKTPSMVQAYEAGPPSCTITFDYDGDSSTFSIGFGVENLGSENLEQTSKLVYDSQFGMNLGKEVNGSRMDRKDFTETVYTILSDKMVTEDP